VVVCHCNAVNDKQLLALIKEGTTSFEQIAAMCGAGARCGGCRLLIEDIVDRHAAPGSLLALRSA
jgi:bacterioferritin-associated ferredoxin